MSVVDVSEKTRVPASHQGDRKHILDPGHNLTLRPMQHPQFLEMYRNSIKNTWSVEEVDFSTDLQDLRTLSPGEQKLVSRLVAFFATGDTIVANNLVLNLYEHVNSPEARMYFSRQLFEESQHVLFYLTLLDNYLPNDDERAEAFAAIEHIPSIAGKADFCFKWMGWLDDVGSLRTAEDRKRFLMILITFACAVEGLFFFGAFAYVYYLRSRGLLSGLADGTDWVFRDESCHISAALELVSIVREEEPELFDDELAAQVRAMIREAVDAEAMFADDVLSDGVAGMGSADMRKYLEYVADGRLISLGLPAEYGSRNPFPFMERQDVEELSNFFERTPTAYQTDVAGKVRFDADF